MLLQCHYCHWIIIVIVGNILPLLSDEHQCDYHENTNVHYEIINIHHEIINAISMNSPWKHQCDYHESTNVHHENIDVDDSCNTQQWWTKTWQWDWCNLVGENTLRLWQFQHIWIPFQSLFFVWLKIGLKYECLDDIESNFFFFHFQFQIMMI